ncbi:AraC family transcriptional regulator [Neobacillus bataviensis LMG 21833]|uniref:AraC family transcriptional regulator n=1 Tax=Neobacillus bataviensis LMG 21833 TaxID=1117379 RepID=K6D348_9BACI|nr:AraC family transcriptional regulator [Neobacillus bataviensis]EKN62674.1 AraC family transcriptional regulator [Neobacillus bataviensis LMG 21833]
MMQSDLIPVINKGFEIHYFSKKNQPHAWLKKYNESAEKFSLIESLFQLHRHDVLEVLVFLDGECEFFCEGKTYSLSRGDIVVTPPYAVHKANVKNFDTYERIIVSVSEHLMDDFQSSSPPMKENINYQKTQGSHVLRLHSKNFQDIISLLQEITNRKESGEDHFSFTLQYLLFQALQVIFDPTSSMPSLSNSDELDQRFISILEYIESHLTEPDLSLDTISDHFHLNKYYFSHYFKNNMNLPFYRYVSLKRLSFAVTMIKQNQISIEEIALKCGFPDYSSFYRLFKKEYNLSPKKLQKEYKNLY